MAAAFAERQVASCVPHLKAANCLITLSLCLVGSPLSCGTCWEKPFSQVFTLRLTGEKQSTKLKRVRGGKLNMVQKLIVQVSHQVFL